MKRQILLFLTLLFLAFESLIFTVTSNLAKNKEGALLDKHVSVFKAEYETVINSYKKLALLFFHETIDDSRAIDIFSKAYKSDNEAKTQIRKELYEELRETYKNLENLNLRQLHFHLPNNESFLRFHAPDKYGDNLTEIRESVRLTNKHKTDIAGFEEGRVFNGFRFVFPLFDKDGTHIGSVETSLSYFAIKEDIERRVNSYVGFIISKDEVERKVFDDHKSFYVPTILSSHYVAEQQMTTMTPKHTFSRALLDDIKGKIKKETEIKLQNKEEFALAANANGSTYIVSFVPIEDVRGKKAAAYLISFNEERAYGEIKKEYMTVASIISALNALIFFLIYLIVKRDRELALQRDALDEANRKLAKKYEDEHKEKIEQETLFRLITESTFDAIVTINENSEIITWNSAAEIMYGYLSSQAVGSRIKSVMLKSKLPNELDRLIEGALFEHRSEIYGKNFEIEDTKKDGGKIMVEVVISPLESDHKQYAVLVVRDITEKKRLEEQQESAQNMLIQQSKMAAMGEMIGVIGHQWKQPLNIIMLQSDILEEEMSAESADKELINKSLGHIKSQVYYMSQTINDFKNFFTPSTAQSTFDVYKEIESATKIIMPQLMKLDIRLEIEEQSGLNVLGYKNEFKQVLLNLITNAKDAMEESGIKDGRITISLEQSSDKNIIKIRDNAGGIAQELLPHRLFENYVTTKGEKGTGIGLNISKTIIEQKMSGKIWAHNVDGGAEFVIELPKAS